MVRTQKVLQKAALYNIVYLCKRTLAPARGKHFTGRQQQRASVLEALKRDNPMDKTRETKWKLDIATCA